MKNARARSTGPAFAISRHTSFPAIDGLSAPRVERTQANVMRWQKALGKVDAILTYGSVRW